MKIHEATIVVRSVYERTEDLCKRLILEQGVKEENLFVIHETPFSTALKYSFEIGIREDLPWTFCIDADVLLRPNSINTMIGHAESQKENVSEIQGLVLDKFFGGPRPAGNHLYRTNVLSKALNKIPSEGVNIRPEYYTLQKLKEDGYKWFNVPYIVGVHDDEQYNYDIYRKCFIQGVKHLKYAYMFVNIWKEGKGNDPDFSVALKAFSDSINNTDQLFIDSNQNLYKQLFLNSGIKEKSKLDIRNLSLQNIESRVNNWIDSPYYLREFPTRYGLDKGGEVIARFRRYLDKHGFKKTIRRLLNYT